MRNGNFLSLVGVENKKLWKRTSTKIVIILLMLCLIGFTAIEKISTSENAGQHSSTQTSEQTLPIDWKEALKENNVNIEQSIKEAEAKTNITEKLNIDSMKKDLSENKYRIEHNITPNTSGKEDFWYFINTMGMWLFVALFIIITTSSLVAGEFAENTMKTMISRPFKRNQILGAKLITTTLFTLLLTIVQYVTIIASRYIMFGKDSIFINQLLWLGGKTIELSGIQSSLLVLAFDFLSTLIYVYFAFFIATISHSRAVATGVSVAVLFGSQMLSIVAAKFSWGKFLYLSISSFSPDLYQGSQFYNISLSFSVAYCLICTLVLILISFITFKKRDIS